VIHLVIDPVRRGTPGGNELGDALIDSAASTMPDATALHLWAMQPTVDDDERAVRHGFVAEREVLQLRVPLPLAPAVLEATRTLQTHPFRPGRDEEAWLHTNNRAFAGHPEQGDWTAEQLHERLAADWVDLDGFLLVDDPADPTGQRLLGSCWTKLHRLASPVLGEIYIVAVDPDHHAQGLGRALTVAGLGWLGAHGAEIGMLYTGADNTAAIGLYRSLGFTLHHVDRAYRRGPGSD